MGSELDCLPWPASGLCVLADDTLRVYIRTPSFSRSLSVFVCSSNATLWRSARGTPVNLLPHVRFFSTSEALCVCALLSRWRKCGKLRDLGGCVFLCIDRDDYFIGVL